LCALLLKGHKEDEELKARKSIKTGFILHIHHGFYGATELDKYWNSLQFLYKKKFISVLLLIIAIVAYFLGINNNPKTAFVPK